jgi:hypothetical protein
LGLDGDLEIRSVFVVINEGRFSGYQFFWSFGSAQWMKMENGGNFKS